MKKIRMSRIKKITSTIFVFLCLTFFVTGQSAINHPLGDLADGANQTIQNLHSAVSIAEQFHIKEAETISLQNAAI